MTLTPQKSKGESGGGRGCGKNTTVCKALERIGKREERGAGKTGNRGVEIS